ncbi:acetyltransferase [Streptomyces atratus]|uniref:GNAT family N-acetyltransferase n=1 Tax=Streptomyces atratus TaxID=1893 RepID=UPI001670E9AA|nr:GNAT family N-acetyltransferase [Streptomyces atratus]GGT11059.1 acetyltransferase [Streptomyces atratus]
MTNDLGTFTTRPLDPSPSSQRRSSREGPISDVELVHSWVTHPKASFWLMGDAKLQDVEREYMAIAAHPHHDAFIGLYDGEPAFLMERYDPTEVELKGLYDAEPGDIGMHFLVAPTDTPLHGFTLGVITAVMEAMFADPSVRRVVVEPDVRNSAVHALNKAVGFEVLCEMAKPEKTALLSVCTREQFAAATGGGV